jgi:hypothetical protein
LSNVDNNNNFDNDNNVIKDTNIFLNIKTEAISNFAVHSDNLNKKNNDINEDIKKNTNHNINATDSLGNIDGNDNDNNNDNNNNNNNHNHNNNNENNNNNDSNNDDSNNNVSVSDVPIIGNNNNTSSVISNKPVEIKKSSNINTDPPSQINENIIQKSIEINDIENEIKIDAIELPLSNIDCGSFDSVRVATNDSNKDDDRNKNEVPLSSNINKNDSVKAAINLSNTVKSNTNNINKDDSNDDANNRINNNSQSNTNDSNEDDTSNKNDSSKNGSNDDNNRTDNNGSKPDVNGEIKSSTQLSVDLLAIKTKQTNTTDDPNPGNGPNSVGTIDVGVTQIGTNPIGSNIGVKVPVGTKIPMGENPIILPTNNILYTNITSHNVYVNPELALIKRNAMDEKNKESVRRGAETRKKLADANVLYHKTRDSLSKGLK